MFFTLAPFTKRPFRSFQFEDRDSLFDSRTMTVNFDYPHSLPSIDIPLSFFLQTIAVSTAYCLHVFISRWKRRHFDPHRVWSQIFRHCRTKVTPTNRKTITIVSFVETFDLKGHLQWRFSIRASSSDHPHQTILLIRFLLILSRATSSPHASSDFATTNQCVRQFDKTASSIYPILTYEPTALNGLT